MANKEQEHGKAKDCAREAVGKGYCRQHFRLWKAGEMPKARYKTCTFEKCRKHRHGTSSLCDEHFKAKHGKPAVVILSADEYVRLRKLEHLKAPSFAELLLAMPTDDEEFERLEGRMREPGF